MIYVMHLLDIAAFMFVALIAVRALMEWFRPEVLYAYKKFFDFVSAAVDPLLVMVRKFFPTAIGRVDFSPVIAVVLVETVKLVIMYLIKLLFKGAA